MNISDLPKKRSQSSKGPFRHQIKHQTPPPIVIPTRVENKATSDHNKNKSFPDSKSNADIDQRSKLNPADNEDEANKSLSSFSSTSSTPSSPPQFEFKNVDNDIYVRHPHPRFPDNNYAINQQNSRNNNFSTPAGVQGVEDNASDGSDINSEQHLSTKLISMTTETFSTDASTLSPSIDISTHCPPAESRNLFWNWTPIHLFASQPCPAGSKGTAKWYCSFYSSVPEWYPAEADLSDCVSRWVLLLEQSLNKDELSVTAFAGELAHMTRVKTLYGGDIQKVTDITNQLITRMEIGLDEFKDDELRSQFVKEVLNATQDICNSLFEDSKRSAWLDLPPKQRIEVATYLIGALERTSVLLSETYTVNSDYSRKRSNIYVAVYTRVSRDIIEEIELPMLMTSGDSKSSASDHDLIETNHLLSSNRVYLPLQTLRQTARESITRISFIMYTKLGSLFKPLQDTLTMDSLLGENNSSTIINSNVISLLLNKDRLPVNAKVRFTLKHVINTNSSNPACVYWDVPSMKWSSSGCELISTNYSHTTCECDHLTNLAVLMQIRDESIVDSDQSALRIITLLGCTISTLCLILTLLSFVLCKSLKGDRIVIHTNLCMCLLIGEVVFLLGIGQTETFLLCRIVALILHYVFLAAFLWMFFESFQLYVMLIEVFESEKSRLPYFYVCSYGIPLAIVSFCYYLDPFSYGTSKHCWLRTDNYFVLSFVGPVVAILMSNLVFLSISLCVMWKQISTVSSVANQNKDESKIKSIR
ncbi:G-protein coupled receptor protein-like protein [Dinothrombium tinctorium]|uniref:G-protein coupled receptor protein-like protein n=1 Tax=Dinothrombium tinctorium TaxID=1965070 RepID=A0A3S3PIH8_9ACAR|nr:G-protein coupled receptor protein-like protein [Dinothrombium tinctorium]